MLASTWNIFFGAQKYVGHISLSGIPGPQGMCMFNFTYTVKESLKWFLPVYNPHQRYENPYSTSLPHLLLTVFFISAVLVGMQR